MDAADQAVRYDTSPAVLVFADTESARNEARTLVEALGARLPASGDIAGAADRLDMSAAVDAVLVDVRNDAGDALDRLLDRLDAAARLRRHPSVVALAPALIDVAAARAGHADVQLLADPSPAERAAALQMALACGRVVSPRLAEGDPAPQQLMRLSQEVGRIARTLAALSGAEEPRPTGTLPAEEDRAGGREATAATIRATIRARRLREQYFDPQLFADPAWDMLLDLFAARLEGHRVAVSSLCIAAAVPPTTALRWMKQLTDDGLVVRIADPRDGRRVFIELSDGATAGMAAYFRALGRMGVALP